MNRETKVSNRTGRAPLAPDPWRALFAGASALAIGLVPACRAPTTVTRAVDESVASMTADFIFSGMRSLLTTQGVRGGEVVADTAYVYADSAYSHMVGVQMTVYDAEGREQAWVSADSGRLEEKSERMTAWGNVVVNLPRTGMRLETSEINYDPPASSIWSERPVVVNHSGGVTSGSGFRSDLNFERFSITNPRGAAYFRPPAQGGP